MGSPLCIIGNRLLVQIIVLRVDTLELGDIHMGLGFRVKGLGFRV
jgi:hypothetical protein